MSDHRIETGISCFDKITGGGIPKSAALALIGDIEGGKEKLARNIAWSLIQKGVKVLYYSVDQSSEELHLEMKKFNWDIKPYEENGLLHIVDIFSDATERMAKEFAVEFNQSKMLEPSFHKQVYNLKIIYDEGMKFIPIIPMSSVSRVVILDTMSPLFSTNTEGVFKLLHVLKFATRLANATGIGILHTKVHTKEIEENFKSIADAIIEVNYIKSGSYLKISKYPGEHKEGYFPVEITNEGFKIVPMVIPDLIT